MLLNDLTKRPRCVKLPTTTVQKLRQGQNFHRKDFRNCATHILMLILYIVFLRKWNLGIWSFGNKALVQLYTLRCVNLHATTVQIWCCSNMLLTDLLKRLRCIKLSATTFQRLGQCQNFHWQDFYNCSTQILMLMLYGLYWCGDAVIS